MDYITVEYSASGNQFHIDTLEHTVKTNRYNAIHRNSNDYQILAIIEDEADQGFFKAQDFIKNFKKKMLRR